MKKTKKQVIEELTSKLTTQQCYQLSRLSQAFEKINKCSTKNYLGSAVTITIKNINTSNNTVIEEFPIYDGLSDSTIEAIKEDIKKSYLLHVTHPINHSLNKALNLAQS